MMRWFWCWLGDQALLEEEAEERGSLIEALQGLEL